MNSYLRYPKVCPRRGGAVDNNFSAFLSWNALFLGFPVTLRAKRYGFSVFVCPGGEAWLVKVFIGLTENKQFSFLVVLFPARISFNNVVIKPIGEVP